MLLHNRCIQRNVPDPSDELEDDLEPVEVDPGYDDGDAGRGQARDVCSALVTNFFS
jgi:hypothetical protein